MKNILFHMGVIFLLFVMIVFEICTWFAEVTETPCLLPLSRQQLSIRILSEFSPTYMQSPQQSLTERFLIEKFLEL